jgi:hypothetical protein
MTCDESEFSRRERPRTFVLHWRLSCSLRSRDVLFQPRSSMQTLRQ